MFKAIIGGFIGAIAFSNVALATCTPPSNGTTADATLLNTYLTCQFAPLVNPSFSGTVTTAGNITAAGSATFAGNLTLSPANPSIISGGSYISVPHGMYISGGTFYDATQAQFRGGIHNDNAAYLEIYGGTSDNTYVNGNLGIGTTTPSAPLEVNGLILGDSNADITGSFGFKYATTAGSSLCYTNAFGYYVVAVCSSLSQYKDNQRTLSLGLDTLMKLHPVEFDWDKQHGGHHDLGFIAQEVEKVNPLLAEYDYKDDPKGKLISVKYMQMTALLTKSLQELKTTNDAQAAEISALKSQLGDEAQRLSQLEARTSASAVSLMAAPKTQSHGDNLEREIAQLRAQVGSLGRKTEARPHSGSSEMRKTASVANGR